MNLNDLNAITKNATENNDLVFRGLYSNLLLINRKITKNNNRLYLSPAFMNIIVHEHLPLFPPPPPPLLRFRMGLMRHVAGFVHGDVVVIELQEDTLGSVSFI